MDTAAKDEILAAVTALSDRMESIEKRLEGVERRLADLGRQAERVDLNLKAVARKLLSPTERVSLGLADVRDSGPSYSPSHSNQVMPMAAQPHGE